MAIAITVRSNPGLVTAVSPAESALPSQILVDSLPEGGAVGVDLYYIGGEVKRAADLTDAERETLGLPPAEEEEETGGSSGTASSPWSDDEDGGLESRGVEMGGSGSNAASESGGGQAAEDERGVTVSGGGTLCRITLPAAEWAARTGGSPHYIFAIANEAITPSTVLQVTGINRDALRRDLLWFSSEGLLTFGTDEPPTEDVVIDCVLIETGDDWQAVGRIDAWPQAAWRSLAYTLDLTKTANNAAVVAAKSMFEMCTLVLQGALRGLGDTAATFRIQMTTSFAVWIPAYFAVRFIHPTVPAYWATMILSGVVSTALLSRRLARRRPRRTKTDFRQSATTRYAHPAPSQRALR